MKHSRRLWTLMAIQGIKKRKKAIDFYIDPSISSFDSIPAAFFFIIVTITTTGYGDIVPATFIGKLVTFPAMVFGVLVSDSGQ
jgi:voltage-gated potassium channel Kch